MIEGSIIVKDCNLTGIPTKYWIKNLPFDTPLAIITSSTGSVTQGMTVIGLCNSAVTLNLAASKGLTKRDIDVQWTLISINPSDDELREQIQANLDETFKGKSLYTIPESYVEKLQGKVVRI